MNDPFDDDDGYGTGEISESSALEPDSTVRSDATTPSIDFDNDNREYQNHQDAEADGIVLMDIIVGGERPMNNAEHDVQERPMNNVENDVQSNMSDDIDVGFFDRLNDDIFDELERESPPPAPLPVPVAAPLPFPPPPIYHDLIRPVVLMVTNRQLEFITACEHLSGGDYFGLVRFIQNYYPRAN